MKIGIVVEKFPSPSETFIITKVIALCERGHEVVVFRNGKEHDKALEQFYKLSSIANLVVVNIKANTVSSALRHPLTLIKALRRENRKEVSAQLKQKYFRQHSCDVYHFEFSGLAISYMPVFNKLTGKIVVSCRGTAEKVKPLTDPARKKQLQQLFSKVDRIHCVSQDMADTIKEFGTDGKNLFINRPAIDATVFKRSQPYTNKNIILSVGRLTFQKGYLIGLLAFREVVQLRPDAQWKIVGDGPCKEEVIFYIHSMDLQNNVELAGKKNRDEIIELYNEAGIFFLPSVYEGIANAALEAMSMELPVVVTKSGGMDEVIQHDVNGYLCNVYDHSAMSLFITNLLNDAEKAKWLGMNARQTVEQDFSLTRLVNVFEKEYSKLLSR